MQISNDPNVWIIYGLVFLLGLLVGLFLTAGGRKKWKTRYYDEVERRKVLEQEHAEAERGWRERDSLRDAAAKSPGRVDRDGDGVPDRSEVAPDDTSRA